MAFFGVLITMGAVFFAFRCRVWTARRWEGSGKPLRASDRAPRRFQHVALNVEPPKRSRTAARSWRKGSLAVDPSSRHAAFSTTEGEVVALTNILDVGVGLRGTDPANTYVEVRYGDPADHRVVYLRDSSLIYFANLLTGSNVRMARSLAACVAEDSH